MTNQPLFQTDTTDLTNLMTQVLSAPAQERSTCFSTLWAAFHTYLAQLEDKDKVPATVRFSASAHTYLRALSTYPAASAEWLDVFRAFKQLFDSHLTTRTARSFPVSNRWHS